MSDTTFKEEPFPVKSRNASSIIGGVATEAILLEFSDKIMITVCQGGRLAQWIQVPLTASAAGVVEMTLPSVNHGLLPSAHLTATTIFGGGGEERETLGQLYASQIGSHLSLKSPNDRRTLVVGLGLEKANVEREAFFDLIELALKVL